MSHIRHQSSIAASFLLSLQQAGTQHLTDVTEKNVFSAFVAPNGSIIRQACKPRIAAFLRICIAEYPVCEMLLAFLPAFKNKRKNIQYLKAEELAKIKNVLSDDAPELTLRDKAIGTLALYAGLRGSDIAGMTMNEIDWDNDLLSIRQEKTEVPLTLPLTAIVGNAIHDYIENERPDTECENVFISQNRPSWRIQGSATTTKISSKIMKAAGIRQEYGDRQGLHLFRHHLATKLLNNGIPRPVISSILGQMSPDSLDTYLSADFPHLKECAISIECFPVAKGVFEI
jgi:integrase